MKLSAELQDRRARLDAEAWKVRELECAEVCNILARNIMRTPMAGLLEDLGEAARMIADGLWNESLKRHAWETDSHWLIMEDMSGMLETLMEWIAGELDAEDVDLVLQECINALEAGKVAS